MKQTIRQYIVALLAILTVAVVAYFLLRNAAEETTVETVDADVTVTSTRAVLDSIRSIGQWELMSIDAKVDVDTTGKAMMGLMDTKLQRRYHGRISIGIDLQKAEIRDSMFILPHAAVLDNDFIDESLTELIVCENQDMEQSPAIKAAMLKKAKRMMLRDVVKPSVLADCDKKAAEDVRKRLESLGVKYVSVTFRNANQ